MLNIIRAWFAKPRKPKSPHQVYPRELDRLILESEGIAFESFEYGRCRCCNRRIDDPIGLVRFMLDGRVMLHLWGQVDVPYFKEEDEP